MLDGDLAEDVGKLKQQYDGDILVAGSATLVRGLLAAGLVDELHLMVFPTALGAGKRLFADGADQTGFDLVDARQTGSVAILILEKR